jgi:choline dehydrogenase-like flavoprotein
MDILKAARLRPMSVVTRVLIDARGRAEGVAFTDARSGEHGVVHAKAVVLSASPVETTRLLLDCLGDLDRDACRHIGKGLVDHFVAGCLVLVPEPAVSDDPPTPFRRAAFIPRFVNMGRAHRRDYLGGFSVELHGPDPLSELDADTLRALRVPPDEAVNYSFYTVHAIGETAPHPGRFVSLHPAERDCFERPVPVLHLARGDDEFRMARDMDETVRAIADALATPGCTIHPIRETLGTVEISHEAGTCRIGRSDRTSAVDLSGQVHGVPGLFVADASLLPTALDRPHTLVVLALALNTADGVLAAAGKTSRTA